METISAPAETRPAPTLFLVACKCGNPECGNLVVGMDNPVIKPSGAGEFCAVVHLAVADVPGVIRRLEQLEQLVRAKRESEVRG